MAGKRHLENWTFELFIIWCIMRLCHRFKVFRIHIWCDPFNFQVMYRSHFYLQNPVGIVLKSRGWTFLGWCLEHIGVSNRLLSVFLPLLILLHCFECFRLSIVLELLKLIYSSDTMGQSTIQTITKSLYRVAHVSKIVHRYN